MGVMDLAPAPYLIRISGHLGATVLSAFPALAPQHGDRAGDQHRHVRRGPAGRWSCLRNRYRGPDARRIGRHVAAEHHLRQRRRPYLTAHLAVARLIGRQALTGLALAHGYDTAFWWTAGIFAFGAVIAGALLRRGPLRSVSTPSTADDRVTTAQAEASRERAQ